MRSAVRRRALTGVARTALIFVSADLLTGPVAPEARRQYLRALHAADDGDLRPVESVWTRRISEAH